MLKIYNSLTNKIEEFKPIHVNKVNMYVCGATTYNDIHIGNARPIVFFEMVKRYFQFLGYECLYVSNITDIDDRIINKAILENKTEKEIAEEYTKRLFSVTKALVNELPDKTPKATEYIDDMVHYIGELVNLGYAYKNEKGVYFRVHKIKDYGLLSNQELEELEEGFRIDVDDEKEDPKDFNLWKNTKIGITFDSPFGKGRPGWHTECAVMNKKIFNGQIDIHGGGVGLKFPHHENEIAQTEAMDHHHLAKYWMHVGHLRMGTTKMSKSLGNVVYVKDIIKNDQIKPYILLILSTNYRQPISYSDELLVQFTKEYDKIFKTVKKTFFTLLFNKSLLETKGHYLDKFKNEMNNDFNTPNALSVVYELIKEINKTKELSKLNELYNDLIVILEILNLKEDFKVEEIDLIEYRDWLTARDNKDYQKADILRQRLSLKGWI
ncbi:cysteine--tRNA ligase [Acholeplasma sp. OttesenSCG-928-E16]|nr:cysteine--tRNA ligase [Acholeplasma sp. OttesenSCG-928-E16]